MIYSSNSDNEICSVQLCSIYFTCEQNVYCQLVLDINLEENKKLLSTSVFHDILINKYTLISILCPKILVLWSEGYKY